MEHVGISARTSQDDEVGDAPRRRLVRTALTWATGLSLAVWISRKVDLRHALAAAGSLPVTALALAVLGLAASYVLRALRMRAELGRGRAEPLGPYLTLMVVHNAAVNVVPLRGGDAAYPVLVHRWLGLPVAQAVGSLVWMRVQDALVLALAGVVLWPGLPLPLRCGGAAAAGVGMLLAPRLLRWGARSVPAGPRWRRLQGAAAALARAPEHGPAGWAFCAASWACKLAAVALCLGAAAHLPAATAAIAALGGELAGALPLQGPAGFGTYEAGVWTGAALRGAGGSEAAVAAALVHVVLLATAIAAGALGHLARARSVALRAPLDLPEAHP
jgi:uncharacterized membrane protein YbhN (UPF0104 family)